jgi:hypothetical protein
MYMHSVLFFNTNSTIMSVVTKLTYFGNCFEFTYMYMHSVLFCDVNSAIMSLW